MDHGDHEYKGVELWFCKAWLDVWNWKGSWALLWPLWILTLLWNNETHPCEGERMYSLWKVIVQRLENGHIKWLESESFGLVNKRLMPCSHARSTVSSVTWLSWSSMKRIIEHSEPQYTFIQARNSSVLVCSLHTQHHLLCQICTYFQMILGIIL